MTEPVLVNPEPVLVNPEPVLVGQGQIQQILGVAEGTLVRWRDKGWITPARRQGRRLFYEVPAPETLAQLRQKSREHQISILACSREMQAANRKPVEPAPSTEGLLRLRALAQQIGVSHATLNDWIKAGLLPAPVMTLKNARYFAPVSAETVASVRRETAQRKARGNAQGGHTRTETKGPAVIKRGTSPRAPATLELEPFAARVPALAPAPPEDTMRIARYDAAVALGQAQDRFQGPLGFNLLTDGKSEFRAAPVNEPAEGGWRYCERHHLNGFRLWCVKAQKPGTGEILL